VTCTARRDPEHQVLILAPTGRDAILAQDVLGRAGIGTFVCQDIAHLCHEAAIGAGAGLITEEALTPEAQRALADLLSRQPPWSDLPMMILTRPGVDSAAVSAALDTLGNVILLERPVRVTTVVSAARGSLRARDRQYELRKHFEDQALLAAIVASSDDAIVSKTLDGIIVTWNVSAERMFGYSADEAIGKSITLIVPPDRRAEERMILDKLVRGERIDHFETVRVARNGKTIDISLTISPIRDATGRIIGASKVARNITAQKKAEQDLRDADRRKDEFLAMLAHELRNPLAPIRNSLHILRLAGKSDSAVERVREMMERQVHHMVRLVDDLLEVSRITRGKIELRKERVDLADVMRSAIETSQPVIEAGGHQLELVLPAEPLIVEGDPIRLAEVFGNLFNNAAKYTDGPGLIRVTATRKEGAVVVSVRDSGIGIASEMLPRVFEMFTQLEGSHAQRQGGLGIGLTLVRSLVEMHGGSVTASSEGPGKGSEFVVRIPLADGLPMTRVEPERKPSSRLPLKVLVADDNHDAADSLGILLKFLGAEVRVVHDGAAALRALETFVPDLALLDIGMPGMDGYEVARGIRQKPSGKEVVLIALTGWGQDEDRRRSEAAGFNHHLIKPADIDALQALMLSVAEQRNGSAKHRS
jgi:PAS domain S-box-containing protein